MPTHKKLSPVAPVVSPGETQWFPPPKINEINLARFIIIIQTVGVKIEKQMWLVQFEISRDCWITIARRSGFAAATAKARSEYRLMRGAKMTAVVRAEDADASILRRRFDYNFGLV